MKCSSSRGKGTVKRKDGETEVGPGVLRLRPAGRGARLRQRGKRDLLVPLRHPGGEGVPEISRHPAERTARPAPSAPRGSSPPLAIFRRRTRRGISRCSLHESWGSLLRMLIAAALVLLLPLAGAATMGKPLAAYLQFPPKTPDLRACAVLFSGVPRPDTPDPRGNRPPPPPPDLVPEEGRVPGRPPSRSRGGGGPVRAWARRPGSSRGAGSRGWAFSRRTRSHPCGSPSSCWSTRSRLRRTGRCLMLSRTRPFLLLFPVSAGFWWSFEYLNRFVGNWRYVGGVDFGAVEYFLFATLPFSTVLPAVLSARELLLSYPRFDGAFREWRPLSPARPGAIGLAALLLSCAGLFAVGIVPDAAFPLVWVAPPTLLISLAALRGEPHSLSGIGSGDWRSPVSSVLAALLCGFFWEMWNFEGYCEVGVRHPLCQRPARLRDAPPRVCRLPAVRGAVRRNRGFHRRVRPQG